MRLNLYSVSDKLCMDKKIKKIDVGYIKNAVNFKLLEEKLKQWNEKH